MRRRGGERGGEPLAVERLDQKAVHAGGEAGVAILDQAFAVSARIGVRRPLLPRLRGRGCGGWLRCRPCPASAGPSARDRRARRRSRAASQDSSAASPLAAMVGRWPSLISSARTSSALISLSSATRIERPLPAARVASAAFGASRRRRRRIEARRSGAQSVRPARRRAPA